MIFALVASDLVSTTCAIEAPQGQSRVAVLDFHDSSGGEVKTHEVLYLSDLVRGSVRRILPPEKFLLMTRENIQELLPQGRTLADCVGDCAVETGRKIGADFVATGDVTSFAGEIRVTVNLHETASGNLLGQVRAGAAGLLGVERDLDVKILELLKSLRSAKGGPLGAGDVETKLGGNARAWTATGQAMEVVSFDSAPSGAMVEVDEQPIGETPCRRALAPGVYRVDVKKVRYVSATRMLEVKPGATSSLSLELVPDFGWITVESEPVGLRVSVDGKEIGVTPILKAEIDTGMHDVLLSKEDYHEEGRRIVVERGEIETVSVAPVPRNGGLTVVAVDAQGNAAAAVVAIDGRTAGRAYEPLTVRRGSHKLEVSGPCGVWRGEYTIVEEEMGELRVALAPSSVALEMVLIPAGWFVMGSPPAESGRDGDEDQHRVVVSQAFRMSTTEVTQALYQQIMGDNPSAHQGPNCPVERVRWFDAVEFCNRLSLSEGRAPYYAVDGSKVARIPEANGYRLPTEAEWEYACRAGTTTAYNSGATEADIAESAWYRRSASGSPHEVGAKAPNGWGLYDMHGNVWEWCVDWYSSGTDGGTVAANGTKRVMRGGSWNSDARTLRSGFRAWLDPRSQSDDVGFRVVRGGP